MWILDQLFTFINTDIYEFLLTRGRRCSGLDRYGLLYDYIQSAQSDNATAWRSLRSLGALVISANKAEVM